MVSVQNLLKNRYATNYIIIITYSTRLIRLGSSLISNKMERARRRKSKSASGIEGVRQIQKYKTVSRLSLDSRSNIDGSTRDDMFMVDLGQIPFRRASGRPTRKLLAEEMYKEFESKRQSPSVIARLMDLEGLPSQWHVHRKQKRFSDSYQPKNYGFFLRQLCDSRSNRRSPMVQQEFKDVHQDLESSRLVNRRCLSRWSASSMLTKSEMALIQQKLIHGKRLSADETANEKLQDSKELDDILDMQDSKKDLLMTWQPDSLFVNHLHDLRVNPSSSLGSHTAVLNPTNSAKYEDNTKAWIMERDTTGKHKITSHLKREDGLLLEPHHLHRANISCKSSKVQLEEKNEKHIIPTRIVVLRPNLRNMQNAGMSGSSPYHSHNFVPNFRKMKEYPSVGGAEKVSCRRKDLSYNVGFRKPISKEAQKIAREITRQMRDGSDETVDAKYSGFRGYAGNESSYGAQESDFDSESEMFNLSSRYSLADGNKWSRYPSSSSVEWSVNGEAKKRLLERWKITHRYQDLEIVSKGSTLGEMLAIPDGETRFKHYANTSLGRANARLGINNVSAMWDGPLGIISTDGSKDEMHKNSSRSRSLPPIGARIHRRRTYNDVLAEEKHLMRSDPIRCGRSKVGKGNLSRKEFSSSQDSKSRSKKPPPCHHIYINEIDSSSEANFEIQMEANVKDLSEQLLMCQIATKDENCGSPVSDVMIAEHGSTTMSSKSFLLHTKQSSAADNDKAAAHDQEGFCLQELHYGPPEEGSPSLQYLGAELASSESSKEADHASPVSVLEVPFTEDASSSSESFEKVSVELNELRMQLQLLTMESGAYGEISTLVPIEEDVTQLSSVLSGGNYILGAEGWELSYALDVLIHSGLQDFGFDMFRMMWHSPDCPLDPRLFDNLEKKYGDEITGLRSERRLLFDRINSALLEIFQQHVDLCPWVMPKLAGMHSTWQKERVRDALEKLINQESANGQVPERVLDREMQWRDSKGEIDAIGNEIEKLLIDDMITEFLCN
ncbi:hypothetical protein Pfo_004319 [Paulownia fortunei]|nr:hypothetical protein Pfo_004319 [Paulownia fortunei]